jgi:hypothetical protein
MAFVLASEIKHLAKLYSIERLGFLTLTFRDHVTQIREAQRRFNSLNTHVLARRYERAIGVWERQKSGRIHFHLVVVLPGDIRTGFDFEAIKLQDYRSANQVLRGEWSFWRKTAPLYRFGRTELLPVKSTGEGIARYVGKYVSKHIGLRSPDDVGARVIRFIGYKPNDRTCYASFAWNTPNSRMWRRKLALFANSVGAETTDDLKRLFGPRWAFMFFDEIMAVELNSETAIPQEDRLRDSARRWAAFCDKEAVLSSLRPSVPQEGPTGRSPAERFLAGAFVARWSCKCASGGERVFVGSTPFKRSSRPIRETAGYSPPSKATGRILAK